ncbi:MAG TPA: TIM barrel protein [Chloroflexota bacterium]|jgi:sugar phosphate isomerase/epimerase
MRFGGYFPGLGPAAHYGFPTWFDGLQFQIDWAKRLGWRCLLPTEFRGWDVERQRDAVARLARHDLVVPGLGAYAYNMLHPDPATRAEHVRAICQLVERAEAIGVDSVETAVGSRHPEVSYAAARGNWDPAAWEDFVRGCREVCAACAGTDVRLTLEPVVGTLLDSPAAIRRALDVVARPETLAINFDLVNFATPELAADLNPIVDELLEAAGGAIGLLHLKDVRYDPRRRVTFVEEVTPGEGTVDFAHWLGRVHALGLDVPAFIEHLDELAQMAAAWSHIGREAARVGAL